jgi:hypothetical protein
MFIVPDDKRSEVNDWVVGETMLTEILSDGSLESRADLTVIRFALRMTRCTLQSIRGSGEPRHSYDIDLPVEVFSTGSSLLISDKVSCAILMVLWASDLALADESAVRLAAVLSIRCPWFGWLLPATVRWIHQASSADYSAAVPLDIHTLVRQHIQTVDQDGVSSMYVAELLRQYRFSSAE